MKRTALTLAAVAFFDAPYVYFLWLHYRNRDAKFAIIRRHLQTGAQAALTAAEAGFERVAEAADKRLVGS